MLRAQSFVVMSLVALFCAATQAAEFKSPKGFTIEYPDSWQVASKEQMDAISGEAKEMLEKLGNLDFDRVAVLIFSPQNDDFAENVNVVTIPGPTPQIDEAARKEFIQALTAQFQKAGWTPKNVESKLSKVGPLPAISVTYEVKYPFFPQPIKQWQAVVRAKTGLLFLTCSAKASDFAKYLPDFEKIVGSLKVDTNPP